MMYWNGNGLYQREFEEFLTKESENKELEQMHKLYVQTYYFGNSQFCSEECNEFMSNCINCSNNEICYHHIVSIPCKHSKNMEYKYVEKLMDKLILKMNNNLNPTKSQK
jgi:predicted AAA+ superfamily ATPase